MNWPALILGGITVALLLPGSKKLIKGQVYVATFRPPESVKPTVALLEQIKGIMPPGSMLTTTSDGLLVVTFTSVSDKEMTDFQTPVGTFELVSVRPV